MSLHYRARHQHCQTAGTVDPSTWHYYTSFTGTLTGTGAYAGLVLSIEDTMHCFEVGNGASGKNVELGASGWFVWSSCRTRVADASAAARITVDLAISTSTSMPNSDTNTNSNPDANAGPGTGTPGYWQNHP